MEEGSRMTSAQRRLQAKRSVIHESAFYLRTYTPLDVDLMHTNTTLLVYTGESSQVLEYL